MADISATRVNQGQNIQVAQEIGGQGSGDHAVAATPAHGRSGYDGIRSGRKQTAVPQLQLKAPGIKGVATPACDDLPGSWCAIM